MSVKGRQTGVMGDKEEDGCGHRLCSQAGWDTSPNAITDLQAVSVPPFVHQT